MKLVALIILIIALAIPASASSVVSWTQKDIAGYNLTLNYTSEFNVAKDDILNISIKNIGNLSENDTITVYKIRVIDPSEADGLWTGSVKIEPNTSKTIDFELNVTTDDEETVNIKLYYTVNDEDKTLNIKANYPGTSESPEIKPWNNITNSRSRTFSVNIDQAVRFNATSDQPIETWIWRKDNVVQDNDLDYFITSWATAGTKTVKVNATNHNGTSNTITWNVTVNAPQEGNAPYITSWGNNKTNDGSLNFTINQSETVRFNFTANQSLTSWHWTLNGETISNPSDTLTRKFNSEGNYKVRASGSNENGTTQTILWKVTVQGTDERDDNHEKTNADIIAWSPQVVDYIYVNDTISETIEYSITTSEHMTNVKWTEDGNAVDIGSIDSTGNTYNYSRTWDDGDLGFHTIAFKGTSDADTEVEFRWYVNVYEINGIRGGNWFDVIDYSSVKVKMFKYKIAKYGSNSEDTLNFVNRLHDSIAARQMTREALRDAFKSGDLSVSEYVAALKQIQSDIKDEIKISKRMTDIEKGIEKEDEEEDQVGNDHSDRVKQNKVNKQESKEEKKKDRSVASNSNGKKKGNKNSGHDDENDEEDSD
ncbi:MAG: PKD domain-containing protein [Candidatus Methanoperedens sp.]|nr:PKD domain-containing protein [Candidatus Methanoperedens sp.]